MRPAALRLSTLLLYVLTSPSHGSSGIFDEITYIKNTNSSSGQFLTWNNSCARKKMAEQRDTYKGREIIVRTGAEAVAARAAAGIGEGEAGAGDTELYIDGERIFILRDAGGALMASGFAFDPQPSAIDLARKIIDYREATQ